MTRKECATGRKNATDHYGGSQCHMTHSTNINTHTQLSVCNQTCDLSLVLTTTIGV